MNITRIKLKIIKLAIKKLRNLSQYLKKREVPEMMEIIMERINYMTLKI
jgi:hypothetical protein